MAPTVKVTHPMPIDPAGRAGPTRGQAAGPRWRRTSSGLFLPADVSDELPEQRIVTQAQRLPAYGAVTGWAAGRLLGAHLLDGLLPDGRTRLPVPLAVGWRGQVRRDEEIRVSHERLPEWHVVIRYGVRVVRAERAVFDEMRSHGKREALVALEAALRGRITSLHRVRAYAASHRSARRFAVVAWALARASEHSWSPHETRLRMIAEEEAGYPRLMPNAVVLGPEGRPIGSVDLLDLETGDGIEFDGADHREAGQHTRDVGKEDGLRRVGIGLTRVTGRDMRTPDRVAERLAAARQRALGKPRGPRVWRVAPRDFDLETWLCEQEARESWHESLPPAVGW